MLRDGTQAETAPTTQEEKAVSLQDWHAHIAKGW